MKTKLYKIVGWNCPSNCKNKKGYPANTKANYCDVCGERLTPIKEYKLPQVEVKKDDRC